MSRIRRLAGGVIASSSPSDASWWRVYADGWCEQGGSITEVVTTYLKIPYASDTSWSLNLTINYRTTDADFKHYTTSYDGKTNKSFIARVAADETGTGTLDMSAEGWISPESLAAIKAGKVWNPSANSNAGAWEDPT